MNSQLIQLTMRELQAVLSNHRVWIGLIAVAAILTTLAPFGTSELLSITERFFYWAIMTSLTFICGTVVATAANIVLGDSFGSNWTTRLISASLTGVPVSLLVWIINIAFFGESLFTWDFYVSMVGGTFIIAIAVSILYYIISDSWKETASAPTNERTEPIFLNRLPKKLGRNLLHISSKDHYVEAVTDRGSHLVLMRFSDALEELNSLPGLRVHRSHWIAENAISDLVQKEGRMSVETIDGQQFPVSRTYQKIVRAELKH